jgi:glutamate formiminotransferase
MAELYEIVPNISEGRNLAAVDAAIAAMTAAGVRVIHRTSDHTHHRSVITAIGSAAQTVAAAVALARVTLAHIDLRTHRGAHPRIGALDVLPFVPLRGATLADAVTLAHRAAGRIWREVGIPSYLYGAAASRPQRALLGDVRRGEFEGLPARAIDGDWQFDYGDVAHESAGAIAVGARPLLVAFNIELASDDLALARSIARTLRESSGGLRTLRALGIALPNAHVQVSFNLTDYEATPIERVTELVRVMAARAGVSIARTELIGLIPEAAVDRAARVYGKRLQLDA